MQSRLVLKIKLMIILSSQFTNFMKCNMFVFKIIYQLKSYLINLFVENIQLGGEANSVNNHNL